MYITILFLGHNFDFITIDVHVLSLPACFESSYFIVIGWIQSSLTVFTEAVGESEKECIYADGRITVNWNIWDDTTDIADNHLFQLVSVLFLTLWISPSSCSAFRVSAPHKHTQVYEGNINSNKHKAEHY